jgi:glutamate 5-kinase
MDIKKIIIKIGTRAIFDSSKKEIKKKIIKKIAKDVSLLLDKNYEVIVVSSGAVGCGKNVLDKGEGIGLKQAQAAIGQIKLMGEYAKAFSKYKIHVAQFLLSSFDLNNKQQLENIKRTYSHLTKKVVSIINENDVTATEELSFGDNDRLAVEILLKLNFDALLVLTDKGALIKNGKRVFETNNFSAKYYDSFSKSDYGFGGLESKLNVAKNAVENGKSFIIGLAGEDIFKILQKKIPATFFYH